MLELVKLARGNLLRAFRGAEEIAARLQKTQRPSFGTIEELDQVKDNRPRKRTKQIRVRRQQKDLARAGSTVRVVGEIPGGNVDRSSSPATTPDVGVSGQCSDVLNNGQARFVAGTRGVAMNVRSATATILIGLLATSQTMAAKPPPPPPPPSPLPQTCPVETGIAFPALAYSITKYKTVKKFGGTQVYDGSDLYILTSEDVA